jgi:hypothetical protein
MLQSEKIKNNLTKIVWFFFFYPFEYVLRIREALAHRHGMIFKRSI